MAHRRREEHREEMPGVTQRFIDPGQLPPTRRHQIQSGGRIVNPQFLPPTREAQIQGWGGVGGAVGIGEDGGPYGWDPPYRDFPYHFGTSVNAPNRRRVE